MYDILLLLGNISGIECHSEVCSCWVVSGVQEEKAGPHSSLV